MISGKNESFFQLSLTELAFILIFVVLLLIGAKFVLVGKDVTECQVNLGRCEQKSSACQKDNNACQTALSKVGTAKPDEIITALVRAPELERENADLKSKNEQLNEKLKAFTELGKKIPDPARAQAAEEFLTGFEKAATRSVPPDTARKSGEDAAQAPKELENCRGQLKHCVKIERARGYGLPPCWTDSSGAIQYLLKVEINATGLSVAPAWPPEREQDARKLPGLDATLSPGLLRLEQFKANTQGIFELSKKANPECRHYVVISRAPSLRDIDQFNLLRLGVEDHFYKLDRTGVTSERPTKR